MKSFKKILSVMLAVLMLLSAFSVCVSAKTKTITWSEYGSKIKYTVRDNFKTGKNTFSYMGKSAHSFTASKEGLYAVSMSATEKKGAKSFGYSYCVSKKATSSTATDYADVYSNEKYGEIYYFKKGEMHYFGVITEGDLKSYTVTLTYLGKVTDAYLKNKDIPLQGEQEIYLNDGQYIFMRDIIFKTDSGKTVSLSDISVPTTAKSLKAGKISAQVKMFGISKKLTFSVFFAQDEIKRITRASGFKAPTAYVDKSGNLAGYEIDSSSLSVNVVLKDGTVIKNENVDEGTVGVTLKDGRKIVLIPMITMKGGIAIYSLGTEEAPLFTVTIAKMKLDGEETPSLIDFFKNILDRLKGAFEALMSLLPVKFSENR